MLFVEILFAVRTITFRSISLYMMHNGHSLPHIFSLQQTTPFSGQQDRTNDHFCRGREKLSVRK